MTTRRCQHEKCECGIRILIVENVPKYRGDLEALLPLWGYSFFVAEGRGEALVEDAKRKARDFCCHVALLDMRLLDDDDRQDNSGLKLIKDLDPVRSVVVTGFGSLQVAREALQERGAFAIVGKEEGPEELRKAIVKAIGETCSEDLRIRWPFNWSSKITMKELVQDEVESCCEDESHLILTKLFPEASSIDLERLSGATYSSSPNPSDGRRKSVVFLANQADTSPEVVKFMRWKRVQDEKENYESYVKGKVKGQRYARLERSDKAWCLGGIVYSFVGGEDDLRTGSLGTFSKFYRDEDAPEKILTPLGKFFELWQYQERQKELLRGERQEQDRRATILASYEEMWRERVNLQSVNWVEHKSLFRYLFDCELPDPMQWILDKRESSFLNTETDLSIVHGDLHGDNLLIDDEYFALGN